MKNQSSMTIFIVSHILHLFNCLSSNAFKIKKKYCFDGFSLNEKVLTWWVTSSYNTNRQKQKENKNKTTIFLSSTIVENESIQCTSFKNNNGDIIMFIYGLNYDYLINHK